MANDPSANSWGVELPTEDLFMAVNNHLTTETLRTLKLSFQTVKEYSFL